MANRARHSTLAIGILLCLLATGHAGAEDYPQIDKDTAGIFLGPTERAVLPQGVKLRKPYKKGLDLTKQAEGFVGRLYLDSSRFCTIGYGHLIKKAPCNGTEPKEFRRGITERRASGLLLEDMETAQWTVMSNIKVKLSDGQYAALCDFVYNVGPAPFKSSTLAKLVNKSQFDQIPNQLRRWVKVGGRVSAGLTKRRNREIEVFFDGAAIPRAAPRADEDLSDIDIQKGEK